MFNPYKFPKANIIGLEEELLNLISVSQIGIANGVAGLGNDGKVPSSQIASDDTKQNKTLDTPITIGGDSETTVEGALGALNTVKADASSVPTAYTSTPEMDGTGSAGSSTAFAKGDHVHPKDTSKADISIIADEFDPTETYAVDDYVMYEGILYKCTTAHTGAWAAADFTATLISDEFGSGGGIADLSAIAPTFSTLTAYAVGAYVTYEGKLYKCTNAHAAGAWNAGDFTETSVDADFMAKSRDYVNAGRKANSTVGTRSTAEGNNNTASADNAHAEGYNCTASNSSSHSEGISCTASGSDSHAEGNSTQATQSYSHAEGQNSRSTAKCAHAEGSNSLASHEASHSEGKDTITGNNYQHVQGKYNVGKATTAFEIGKGTSNNARSNAFEVEWDGDTIAAGEITDGGGNVLSDKYDATSYVDRYERYTITSSNWSATADANGYYTYSLTTSAYNTYKGVEMSCTGSDGSTDPTSAQKAAYSLVEKFYMADGTGVTSATLYAKTKPTTTFYIMLKGNYAAKNAASSTKALDITTANTLDIEYVVFDNADGYMHGGYEFDGSAYRRLFFVEYEAIIASGGWSSTVNSNGYYTNTVSLQGVISSYVKPTASLASYSALLPTSAETAAYNLVDYFEIPTDISASTITAYAKVKPTTHFKVHVSGDWIRS